MKVDERVVVMKPKSVREGNRRTNTVWTRRAAMRVLWEARCRILKETKEDIFGLFTMTDCIEVNLKGVLETLHVEPKKRVDTRR